VKHKNGRIRRVKSWETITDNLSKAGWSWGCVSAIDSQGRRSGLLPRTATTEGVSLCTPMKSWLCFWNWKRRFGPWLIESKQIITHGSRLAASP